MADHNYGLAVVQTDDVNTTPLTCDGPSRAAPLAAEFEPRLAPTSHTGTGAFALRQGDDRRKALRRVSAGAVIVRQALA